MVESTTSIFGLTKPDIGGSKETWGNYLNADLDRIDTELSTQNQSQWYGLQQGHPDSAAVTVKKYDSSGHVLATANLASEQFRTAANTLLYTNDIVNSIGTSTAFFAGEKPGAIAPMDYVWRALDLLMPVGTVIMWSGLSTNIPDGWRLCNGDGSTIGVPIDGLPSQNLIIPDLRGYFVIAAFEDANVSDIKPWYKSGVAGVFGHTHASIVGDYTLVPKDLPPHRHGTLDTPGSEAVFARATNASGGNIGDYGVIAGNIAAFVDIDTKYTGSASSPGGTNGVAQGHNHPLTNVPNTGDPDSPFFALCYIIKWRHWQSWARGRTAAMGPI